MQFFASPEHWVTGSPGRQVAGSPGHRVTVAAVAKKTKPGMMMYMRTEVKSRGLKQKEAGMLDTEPMLRAEVEGNLPDAVHLAFKVAAASPWEALGCG